MSSTASNQKKVLCFFLCALFWASTASAADPYLTNGRKKAASSGNIAALDPNDTVRVTVDKKKSYACTLIPEAFSGRLGFGTSVSGPESTVTGTLIGDVTPGVTVGSSDTSSNDNRISFTAEKDGLHSLDIQQSTGDFPADANYLVECSETTLFGAYNTVVNDFNFLELENTTNSTIAVTITAVNFDDTLDSPTAQITLNVNSNSRSDVNLHDQVGDNKFGILIVAHDGPLGALKGRVSQYVGTAESFSLSVTVPLTSREQTH